jgi:hypothetical protein
VILYDASGAFVASDAYSSLGFLARESGTYYVQAAGFGTFGTYHLAVSAEPYVYVDDYGDGTSTNGEIAAGEDLFGWIGKPGDQDWFSISLTEGQAYAINLAGTHANAGFDLPDPYLVLHDANGNEVASNDNYWDGSVGSRIDYTASTTGTYYVDAQGVGGATGAYELSVDLLVA